VPNTIGTVVPGTLMGQIEAATIAAAATAFVKNPPAARAILQAAAVALLEPPVGPFIVAAVATAVAAYCLAQWGADPAVPNESNNTNNTGGWLMVRTSSNPTYNQFQIRPGQSFKLNYETSGVYPTIRMTSAGGTSGMCTAPANNQAYYTTPASAQWIFFPYDCGTGVVGTQIPTSTYATVLGYSPLTDDDKTLIGNVGTIEIPRAIPKKPAAADDPNQTIPPLIAGVKTDLDNCCATEQASLDSIVSTLAQILARVKKASSNLGLPDLDGANTGYITGQNADTYTTLSNTLQELLRALGPWPSGAVTNFNSATVQYSSVRRGIDTLKDRLNYDTLESTPTPTNANQQAGDVQSHIRYTKYDGVDASFHTGYADTAPAHNHLKIIFTDTSKYRNRQNASMHVPNPKTTLTDAQIKGAIPVRILGSYWCTLLMADKTKLVGWFPSSTVGQTQLTALAALTVSGVSNPVRFTSTLKTSGVPAISGTSLAPTGYAYNKLNSDGTSTLVTKRI